MNELKSALTFIRELLKGGSHEGPCTNAGDPYDSCDLHMKASREREEKARRFLCLFPEESAPWTDEQKQALRDAFSVLEKKFPVKKEGE